MVSTTATTTLIEHAETNQDILVPIIKTAFKNSTNFVNTNLSSSSTNNNDENSNTSFMSKLYAFKQEKLSNLRPVTEFFDKNRFNLTSSFQLIVQRWNYNLQYFSANYSLIMVGLILYSVLTNWFLLFTICFVFGGFYMISRKSNNNQEPIDIGGFSFSTSKLYTTYAFSSFLLLLFSGATGTIFWIIGASALIILGHAAVLEPGLEGDFADNQV